MGPPEALPSHALSKTVVPSKSNTLCGFTVFVLAASFLGTLPSFTKLIFLELPPNLSATYSKALGFSITYKIIISLSSKELYNNKSHFYLQFHFTLHWTDIIHSSQSVLFNFLNMHHSFSSWGHYFRLKWLSNLRSNYYLTSADHSRPTSNESAVLLIFVLWLPPPNPDLNLL